MAQARGTMLLATCHYEGFYARESILSGAWVKCANTNGTDQRGYSKLTVQFWKKR